MVSFMALYKISTYSKYTEVFNWIYVVSHYFESSAKLLKSSIYSCAYFWVLFLACNRRRRGDLNDQWYRHNQHHYIDQHTIKISIPLYQIHWMNALKEEERKNCFNYHFLCNLSAYIMLMVDVHNKYFSVHKTWHQKRYIFWASLNFYMTFGQ